jgi:Subtilase family
MLGIPRRHFSSAFFAAFLTSALFSLAMPAPGGAAAASSAESPLAPQLEQLSTPALAEAPPEAQAEAIGLPVEGAGSLSREGERVVVEAHFEGGALARLEALEAAGAKILVASKRYQTVALSVEPTDLEAIAEVPGIDVVEPSLRPMVYATEEGGATTSAGGPNAICEGGSVISKGFEQLKVNSAREAFGARGRGITVGVLSDSFNVGTSETGGAPATKAEDDERTDDLPGLDNGCSGQQVPVRVIAEAVAWKPGELHDEGRAMLQVVHDLAPHAQLAFATAYGSELEFAQNIEKLAKPVEDGGAGAKVIVDDVAYYNEPFFQEGPVADAIRRVTEAGVTYLTAAGNNNLIEAGTGAEIGSWERAEFADTACPAKYFTLLRGATSSCLNFSPHGNDYTLGIKVKKEASLTLDVQWAEPWYGVKSDLDAYLVNEAETEVLAGGPVDNTDEGGEGAGSEKFSAPVELLTWKNESTQPVEVELIVDRCINACNPSANATKKPRVKIGILENGSKGVTAIQYHSSEPSAGITVGPTVFGHAGSAAAITVGAIRYSESNESPKEPEFYSSRGPSTYYFGPVNGTSPAAALPTPEVVSKPDITATDCAATTFFSSLEGGTWRFCGTSEAAPHAAAVAALMKQTETLAGSTAIRKAMQESATKFPLSISSSAVGAGLLNAAGALTALGGLPVDDPPSEVIGPREPPHEEGIEKEGSGTEGEKEKEIPIPTPTPTPLPAPVVSVTKGPASVGNESRPTFEFGSSQPASFTCQIDGAAPQPCTSPYVAPSALSDGQHGFAVVGTDAEGRSGASNTYYFTVDTKAPRARIVGHPAKLVKTAKPTYAARFRLTADQSPVTFYCQVDREPLRTCGASMTAKVKPGNHVLKVRARDELGNMSVSPSTYRFRVKQVSPAHSRR